MTWNPKNDKVDFVGRYRIKRIDGFNIRGSTIGGIAATKNRGVHVVYNRSGSVYHRIIDKDASTSLRVHRIGESLNKKNPNLFKKINGRQIINPHPINPSNTF